MLQSPPHPAVYGGEADLRQLVATLWRHRASIAIVTAVCAIFASAYTFLTPKVYESQVLLQLSAQGDPVYASPTAAARLIGSLTFLSQVGRAAGITDGPQALQKRVNAEPVRAIRDIPFVRVRVRAPSPDDARLLAERVAMRFVSQASEENLERRRAVEERLAGVHELLADIRRALAMSRQSLAQLQVIRPKTELEVFTRAFTLNTIEVSENLYSSLLAAQRDLTVELINLHPPKLIEEPTLPDIPVAPKPRLNISIAGFLGLVMAIVGVLVREAFQPRQTT